MHALLAMCYTAESFAVPTMRPWSRCSKKQLPCCAAPATVVCWTALFLYGDRALSQGDLARAEQLYRRAWHARRRRSWSVASPLGNLGRLAIHRERMCRAKG